jgi:hypothetical protein
MRSSLENKTRWCPVCESRGIPIVWGEPSEHTMRLAEEGRVILAGCTPVGIHASHGCGSCDAEFIAYDRVYRRQVRDVEVIGIGVWPHGRRPVRVEDHDEGWTVVVAGEGSMIISREAAKPLFAGVFEDMSAWEIEEWVRRRGFDVSIESRANGWLEISISDPFRLFGLILVKTWWRTLGRGPVQQALERLGPDVVWLAEGPGVQEIPDHP